MLKTESEPLVSVIIPAYNAVQWIQETIDSVLNQTYPTIEVIVVDDGSTDDTADLVAAYSPHVTYVYKENGKRASACNRGIPASHGRYLAFVDADDLWTRDKISLQMALFIEHSDLVWVYCDAMKFDDSGKMLYKVSQAVHHDSGNILKPLLLHNFIPCPTPVIRRDVFDRVGLFNETILRSEDWDMWLRIAAHFPVGYVAQPLAKHRVHQSSLTQSGDTIHALRVRLDIVERTVASNPDRLSPLRAQALSNVHLGIGQTRAQRGDRSGAREGFWDAFRLYPKNIKLIAYWLAALLPLSWLRLLSQCRRWMRRLHG